MAGGLRQGRSPAPAPERPPRWPADDWRGPLLAVRLSSLGDVVLTTGPLRLLHDRRPDLAIDLLTRAAFAPALAGLPFIRRILLADGPDSPPDGAAAAEPAAAAAYATVLEWQGGARGARAAAASAPGALVVRAGRAAWRRRLLVLLGRRAVGVVEPYAARLARSLAGGRVDPQLAAPWIAADEALRAQARERLARLGSPRRGWAVLAPGASRPMKRVPERLAGKIAAALAERGWGVVRLAAPAEGGPEGGPEGRPEDGAPGAPGEGPWRGTLPQVAALIAEAGLFIGADSGILHIAAGLDTPAVGLFGPTAPELGFAPLGRARVAGVELPCRPCHIHGPRRCWLGHARCWRELSAGAVLDAAEEVLDGPPRGVVQQIRARDMEPRSGKAIQDRRS